MKLIISKNSLKRNINLISGSLITINNEYLYLLKFKFTTQIKEVNFLTIDSGYILSFLKLFYSKNIQLITGYDILNVALRFSNRKIIIIGKENKNEMEFLKKNKNVIKINAIFGTSVEIFKNLKSKIKPGFFDDSIIFLMLGAEKQEQLSGLILKKIKPDNSLIAGLGGTWEQFVDNKKVPSFYLRFKLSWLYRTIMFWDKSKPIKILRSLLSFFYYNELISWIKAKL